MADDHAAHAISAYGSDVNKTPGDRPDNPRRHPFEGDGPEWELFDLLEDPQEVHSVYEDPVHARLRARLTDELGPVSRPR